VSGARLVGAALVVALALVGAYAALGGGRYEPPPVADPCRSFSLPAFGDGDAFAQHITLGALRGVACLLHVSREELALALVSKKERDRVLGRTKQRLFEGLGDG
jgi:hypothetical protein